MTLPEQTPQQNRENADPDELSRPLPWFLIMLFGAMAMWGGFYIQTSSSGGDSSYGDQRTLASLRPPVKAEGMAVAAVDGKQIFAARCAACHQANGLGLPGVFPPLAGSEWVVGDERTLTHILLHGIEGDLQVKGVPYNGAMPPWQSLGDDELAAVMTYIRSEWGNDAPKVSPETVKAQREATKLQDGPYKGGKDLASGV